MRTTTFETAKVGDRVWSLCNRTWYTVIKIDATEKRYPIVLSNNESITFEGSRIADEEQLYFWDEIVIVAPQKPLPDLEVDTPVIVWDDSSEYRYKRYFSHYTNDGRIECFVEGRTSWSSDKISHNTTPWKNWELVE
jgi:hypothetical protein